ncbi:MAG: carboxypeptidase-like regulatory domain-containing protein, partial [Bacteroidales bacterium]|nr:carboxypeptidase-like regulatory domain-containing protein [Bacteroidales bacterium]
MMYLCTSMKKAFSILLLLVAAMSLFGQSGRITGVVRDAESGETLIGVAVYEPQLKKGVTTNEKGKYEIDLPEGSHQLQFSYVGFETFTSNVTAGSKPKTLNVKLQPMLTKLSEVEITG